MLGKITLTSQQREVNHLVLLGFSNAQIAEKLCVQETTVKSHLTNIYKLFGSESRSHHIANHYLRLIGEAVVIEDRAVKDLELLEASKKLIELPQGKTCDDV